MSNTLYSTGSQDVVAVFNQGTNQQVFDGARPIKATISETSQVMSHPVEDGTTVTDHKIINPVKIQFSMILSSEDYRSVYRVIKEIFINSDLLSIQTKSGVYTNMIISSMPHDEDPNVFNGISLSLELSEVKFAEVVVGGLVTSPADPTDQNTQNGGKKNLSTETGTKRQSLLREILQ